MILLLLILLSLFMLMNSGVLFTKRFIYLSLFQNFFSIESIKYIQIFKNIEDPFVD